MPFSLWSRGQLLGESDLELPTGDALHLTGPFRPTAAGVEAMPILTGVATALFGLAPMFEREGLIEEQPTEAKGEAVFDAFHGTDEGTRAMEALRRFAALQLEVRDTEGQVLPTEAIMVHDFAALASIVEKEVSLAPEARDLSGLILYVQLSAGA